MTRRLWTPGERVLVWGDESITGSVIGSTIARRQPLDEVQLLVIVLLDDGFWNEAHTVYTTMLVVDGDFLREERDAEFDDWEEPEEVEL